MSDWMLICQSKYFDIKMAFEQNNTITWPQVVDMKAGDVVYFYVTNPYRAVLYKCKVEDTQLHHMDDEVRGFVLHPLFYDIKQTYVRLRLLQSYPEGLITDEELKKNGMGSLQVSGEITSEFSRFLKKTEGDVVKQKKIPLKIIIIPLILLAIVFVAILFKGGQEEENNEDVVLEKSVESDAEVTADLYEIYVGETTGVAFEIDGYIYRSESGLTWESGDESIASVSADGIVTAIAPGEVQIQGEYEGIKKSVYIHVKEEEKIEEHAQENNTQGNDVHYDSIEVNCYTTRVLKGDSIDTRLMADTWIFQGNSSAVKWSTDNEDVAYVDEKGVLHAKEVGKCFLTAECDGKTDSQEITVVDVDENSGAAITTDFEKIGLTPYGEDVIVVNFEGNMPQYYGAAAYYSSGVAFGLEWGELNTENNSVSLTISDLASEKSEGYVTILAYDDNNPEHIVAMKKIYIRIN